MSVANTAGEKNRKPQLDPTANPSSGHSLAATFSVSSFRKGWNIYPFYGRNNRGKWSVCSVENDEHTENAQSINLEVKKKYAVGTR